MSTPIITKSIVGYEGLYEVDTLGRIWSLNYRRKGIRKCLKQHNNNGYKSVILCNKGRRKPMRTHRILASTFLPNPLSKPDVNHIDGDPSNNRLENLEWCTELENSYHAIHVLGKNNAKENNGRAVLSIKDVEEIRRSTETLPAKNASKYYGVSLWTIYAIRKNHMWRV